MHDDLPEALIFALEYIVPASGMVLTQDVVREAESSEYGAWRFGLNGYGVAFRIARTTPIKIGQFVTLWKRSSPESDIAPLDSGDPVDYVMVSVSDTTHHGYFVFDKEILLEKKVMSHRHKGGKRAMRVYPPWTRPVSSEALRTQKWQLRCFLPITQDRTPSIHQTQTLFKLIF